MSDLQPVDKGSTTLDFLKTAYPWLAKMLDDKDAEIAKLQSELDMLDYIRNSDKKDDLPDIIHLRLPYGFEQGDAIIIQRPGGPRIHYDAEEFYGHLQFIKSLIENEIEEERRVKEDVDI